MLKLERLGVKMGPMKDSFGSFARFNPGCVRQGDIIHMLYRSAECTKEEKSNYITSIGYAKLDLEGNVLYDSNRKVIFPTCEEEAGGCEDPRIIEFEGYYYIFYTAYDGRMARVAIARTTDFNQYEKLGIIYNKLYDKDAFIFPKRINGKIAYMHRAQGTDIQIDYFNSINDLLTNKIWNNYDSHIEQSIIMKGYTDSNIKIGGGAPPVYTDAGWIMIYHSVNKNVVYSAEAALLDKDNPSKVIAKLPYSLFSPETEYELYGDNFTTVFPEGCYQHNGYLYIYYGSADQYICLARTNMQELMDELLKYRR